MSEWNEKSLLLGRMREVEKRESRYCDSALSSAASSEGEAPNEESEEERTENGLEEQIKKLETLDFAVVLLALKNGVSYAPNRENMRKRPWESDSENGECLTGDEEFYFEEETKQSFEDLSAYRSDDEEWQGSLNRVTPTSKSARKKAPSGTACEKHKRWKKRCPEDCPMRIVSKYRRINPQTSVKPATRVSSDEEEYQYPVSSEKTHRSADSNGAHVIPSHLPAARSSLNQRFYGEYAHQSLPFYNEPRMEKRTDRKKSRHTAKSSRRKRTYLLNTIACEYHTILHARCPPNCPDRRPARPHSRTKFADPSSKAIEEEQMWEKESEMIQDEVYDSMDDSLPEDLETSHDMTESSEMKSNSSKRKGKKYLASACERHKLLHSRCPINCPDRVKGDRVSAVKAAPSTIASH